MASNNSKEKVVADIIRVERDKFYGAAWTGMLPKDFMLVFQKAFYEFTPASLGRWKDALETKNRKTPVVSDVIIISNAFRTTPGRKIIDSTLLEEMF